MQTSSSRAWQGLQGFSAKQATPPPTPPARRQRGGGGDHQATKEIGCGATQLETESACLLLSINAFPSSIEELADMPVELVGRAIAYAESEPGIESIPGWVVEALRRHRDEGWPIPAPLTRSSGLTGRDRPIDVEHYTSGAYGDLFRLGSDTTGLEDSSLDLEELTPVQPDAGAPAQFPEENLVQPSQPIGTLGAVDAANRTVDSPRTESADESLTHEVQAELMLRCGRRYGRLIAGLRVHVAGGTSLLICATFADLDIVQRELIGALQRILGQLGAPSQLVFTTRAGWEARNRDAGNDRSRPKVSQDLLTAV